MDRYPESTIRPRPCWRAIGEKPWWGAAMPIRWPRSDRPSRTFHPPDGVRTFLHGLRHGQAHTRGKSGNYFKLTCAISQIGLSLVGEHPAMALLAPVLLPIVPMVTLVNYVCEILFERKWSRRLRNELVGIPVADPLFEVTDIGE